METLIAILGYVLVAATGLTGVGALLLLLFRKAAEKWIGVKFDKQLEAFRHEQRIEIERLKSSISAQLDRATKLHQREFEVLPKAWGKLKDAHGIISELVSRGKTITDLNAINDPKRDDFLSASLLAEWQSDLVLAAKDKTETYRSQVEPYRIGRARKASAKFYKYFQRNGIFIRPSIKRKIDEIDGLMLGALEEHVLNFQHGFREFRAGDKLRADGKSLLEELEADVQQRLWDSTVRNEEDR
jgi:hypothetical protein